MNGRSSKMAMRMTGVANLVHKVRTVVHAGTSAFKPVIFNKTS